jgi:hypothetical protein
VTLGCNPGYSFPAYSDEWHLKEIGGKQVLLFAQEPKVVLARKLDNENPARCEFSYANGVKCRMNCFKVIKLSFLQAKFSAT